MLMMRTITFFKNHGATNCVHAVRLETEGSGLQSLIMPLTMAFKVVNLKSLQGCIGVPSAYN